MAQGAVNTIAVIGAGMAGLTCARRLAEAGITVSVFDKGRGLGGRIATRRVDPDLAFDHGAPYLTAIHPGFRLLLETLHAAGSLATWSPNNATTGGGDSYVGVPGMTGMMRPLAEGLDVGRGAEVSRVERRAAGWFLTIDDTPVGPFDAVVSTAPAPQTAVLFAEVDALRAPLQAVRFDPCWALLIAFEHEPVPAGVGAPPAGGPFAWLARNAGKPGRPAGEAWVFHATAEWSRNHLELDRQDVVDRLRGPARAAIGIAESTVRYAAAHRWRYAQVAEPLGQPCLTAPEMGLFAAGDWCLGPTAEHAYLSGIAAAEAILAV